MTAEEIRKNNWINRSVGLETEKTAQLAELNENLKQIIKELRRMPQ